MVCGGATTGTGGSEASVIAEQGSSCSRSRATDQRVGEEVWPQSARPVGLREGAAGGHGGRLIAAAAARGWLLGRHRRTHGRLRTP